MQHKFLLFLVAILTIFSGCWRHKKYSPVPRISHVRSHGSHDLDLTVARCSSEVSVREVGVDLTASGYAMVSLHIVNSGGDSYVFRPSYCELPRASTDQLAEFVYYDTSTRCIWLSVPSFLLWWPAIPLVVVPCGLMWSQQNRARERYINKKIVGPDTCFKIAPYETVEKFLFVPEEEWPTHFSIGFFDKSSKELVRFSVAFDGKEG